MSVTESSPETGPAAGSAVELDVERIAYGGEGVGRADGLVVFVPWTAPGDRARARIIERHPRWARARLEGVLGAGPGRVEPGCPVYGICGGCRLQHLDRTAQLDAKARAVTDALERIARRSPPGPIVCEEAARPWHYRRRATFTWRRTAGSITLGFHAAEDPAAIVDVDVCPIFVEDGNRVLGPLREALAGAPGREVEEGRLVVRALPGREAQAGVFAEDATRARELADACARSARILVTWGTPGGASAPLALSDGAPRLASTLDLGGLKLRVGFDSFLQADPEAAERLYEAAEEGLEALPGQRVIDGYAGVGALTCRLARSGVRVTAVESHPGAASDLRANAAASGGEPVHVLELPAERVDWRRPRPDAVVVNPPRTGCAAPVIDSIVHSTARRIVYISCDPTTLARDVRRLGDGWRLDSVRAFDLFPQTAHVETVSVLGRGADA
ncbi:MAG TPA: class I SAM-dependent RNA methyltransferase [Gemmatimonadota bacterium]|nr:class I SAM-dependent RNA methyltransferase [Gemmatimonadota bacterium]